MNRFNEIISAFSRATIGVIGDIVADLYILGHPDRLSREAPVMIVRHEEEKLIPGCAANTMNNLLSLGCNVMPVAVIGDDDHGRRLMECFQDRVTLDGMVQRPGLRTVCKTRILVGEPNRTKQQVIRIDYEHEDQPLPDIEEQVLQAVDRIDAEVDAWLVSDYDYFVISPAVARRLLALTSTKPLVVDSRYRSTLFKGASCFTPNEGEAQELAGVGPRGEVDIEAMGRRLLAMLEAKSLIITRGNHGMAVFEGDGSITALPTVGDDEVVDVSGAGDTVAATVAASLVAGATTVEAARLASCAAGVVVMKTGAATCTASELTRRIPLLKDGVH